MFAIEIQPAPIFADESTDLVQPRGSARLTTTGDEFHGGVIVVLLMVLPDLQAQPFQIRRIGIQVCRARVRMPGIE